jgi:hypothetical protein
MPELQSSNKNRKRRQTKGKPRYVRPEPQMFEIDWSEDEASCHRTSRQVMSSSATQAMQAEQAKLELWAEEAAALPGDYDGLLPVDSAVPVVYADASEAGTSEPVVETEGPVSDLYGGNSTACLGGKSDLFEPSRALFSEQDTSQTEQNTKRKKGKKGKKSRRSSNMASQDATGYVSDRQQSVHSQPSSQAAVTCAQSQLTEGQDGS